MDEILNSHRRLESRGGRFCQVSKVVTCGCMMMTAVLFPLAHIQTSWLRFTTLSIFIITTLSFTALHIEPFLRFGPFTLPVALVILLLAVLSPGAPRKDIVPWLPLFIASTSLSTVAIHEFSQRYRIQKRLPSPEDGRSDTWSRPSTRRGASSDGRSSRRLSEINNRLCYGQYGPSSHYSGQSGDSELTLSGLPGQPRPHWDATTQSFFQVEASHAGHEHAGAYPDTLSELSRDLASDNATTRLNEALLGSLR